MKKEAEEQKRVEEEKEREIKQKLEEEQRILEEERRLKEWEEKFDLEQKKKEEALIQKFYSDKSSSISNNVNDNATNRACTSDTRPKTFPRQIVGM